MLTLHIIVPPQIHFTLAAVSSWSKIQGSSNAGKHPFNCFTFCRMALLSTLRRTGQSFFWAFTVLWLCLLEHSVHYQMFTCMCVSFTILSSLRSGPCLSHPCVLYSSQDNLCFLSMYQALKNIYYIDLLVYYSDIFRIMFQSPWKTTRI